MTWIDTWKHFVMGFNHIIMSHKILPHRLYRRHQATAATLTKSLSTRSHGYRALTGRSSTASTRPCSETSPSSTRGWPTWQHADQPNQQTTNKTQTIRTVMDSKCRFGWWMSQNWIHKLGGCFLGMKYEQLMVFLKFKNKNIYKNPSKTIKV